MAEGLLREDLPSHCGGEVTVSSAGTRAWNGQPAASLSVMVMKKKGIDISRHEARFVTPDIINKASLIVALTSAHMEHMKAIAPGSGEWMIVLGALDPERENAGVEDPIGGSTGDYQAARDDIARLIVFLLEYIAERFDLQTDTR